MLTGMLLLHSFVLLLCSISLVTLKVKIILVGIQKSGTTSYQEWFTAIGLKSAHWQVKEGPVAGLIFQAKKNGLLLLHYLEDYDAITEINHDGPVKGIFSCYYPQISDMEGLYIENPDALFILNTRNVQQQVASMMKTNTGRNILTFCKQYLRDDKTKRPINLNTWILQHNAKIRTFFGARPEAKFVEVALESLNSTIFDKYFDTKGAPFPHCNKT